MNLKISRYFTFTPEFISKAIRYDFNTTLFNFCFALNLSFYEIYIILQGDILARYNFRIRLVSI